MNFQISLAAKYLWGRKLRSFLTTLAIVIGVMVIFGMGILLPSMQKAFEQSVIQFGHIGYERIGRWAIRTGLP